MTEIIYKKESYGDYWGLLRGVHSTSKPKRIYPMFLFDLFASIRVIRGLIRQ